MIPYSIIEQIVWMKRSERASRPLRAYAQYEWRREMSPAPTRPRKGALAPRLRRWLHRRVNRPSTAAPEASAVPPAETRAVAASASEPCLHPLLEDLGFAGSARFLRCALCGRVLVVQAGRSWTLGPEEPATVGEIPDA